VTHKDSLAQIQEDTDAAITTKGQYYPPGKIAPPGERKLYLLIEAPTERGVQNGKQKLKETIEAEVNRQALPGGFTVGKYKV
jgi:ATP-dependent RNA helicase DDX46/PRP5